MIVGGRTEQGVCVLNEHNTGIAGVNMSVTCYVILTGKTRVVIKSVFA